MILGLLSNTIFLGVVIIGQQDSKLFIQYKLTEWYGIGLTATYLSWIVASSRIIRIGLNMLFNKWYSKLKNRVPIILSIILVLAFVLIVLGAIIPVSNLIKVLLMALGFGLIIPMRDTFVIYMEDLLLKNSQKNQQQEIFTNMEVLRKFGKIVMNLCISILLLKIDLYYIMYLFMLIVVIEIIISTKIIKMRKI